MFYEPCKVQLDPHRFPIFFVLISANTNASAEQIMRAGVHSLLPLPDSRAQREESVCVFVSLPSVCLPVKYSGESCSGLLPRAEGSG